MTIYKSTAVTGYNSSGRMPDVNLAGLVLCRTGTWVAVTLSAGSYTVQMVPVPKGAQILDIVLYSYWTSHGTIDVGDGSDHARYIAQETQSADSDKFQLSVAGVTDNTPADWFYVYSADDTIDIIINDSDIDAGCHFLMHVFYKMGGQLEDEDAIRALL